MKRSNGSLRHRRPPTPPARRRQLLAAFDRSRLSAAAFARRYDIGYTTFCGWRHRRAETQSPPSFVQVELATPTAPVELLVELGGHARLRLTSASQVELAVRLLHRLHAAAPC